MVKNITQQRISSPNLPGLEIAVTLIKSKSMFDEIMNLLQKHGDDAIVKNTAIPDDKNEAVIQESSSSIFSSLQGLVSGGQLNDVVKMFGGNSAATGTVNQQVSGNLVQNLMDKFGFSQQQASGVADKVVPNVMNDMVAKANDPADNSMDVQGIFNKLSGGPTSGFNIQSLIDKVKSGKFDLDGDGDTDLQDLMSLVKGGGGGNLMDKVKGLFS